MKYYEWSMKQKCGVIKEMKRILKSFNYTFCPLNPLGEPFLKNDSAMVTTGGLGAYIEDCLVDKLKKPYIRSIDKSNKSSYDFCNNVDNVFVNIKTTNTNNYSPIVAGKIVKELYNKNNHKKIYIIIHIPYDIDETTGSAIVNPNNIECYTLDSVIFIHMNDVGYIKSDGRHWSKEVCMLSGRISMVSNKFVPLLDSVSYYPRSFKHINNIIKNLDKYLKNE